MRLELRSKFIIASLLVAATSLAVRPLVENLGVPPWGAIAIALCLGGVIGWTCQLRLTRELRALRSSADRIRSGDLTGTVDLQLGRRYPDETSDLARSVDGIAQNLRELVSHMEAAAQQVSDSSRELSLSTQGVKTTFQEISSTMEGVAAGAVRQQEDAERTARRSHEISESLDRTSESVLEASAFASEANHRADSGVEVTRRAVGKMQLLFERAEEAGRLVVQFEPKIRSVHRITEVITSVADKTHLLSLNASIEAARAGDAGRGFTAVAEEIRKLAESSGEQAEQIEDLVRQLEDQSRSISEVMRSMGDEVSSGRSDLDGIQCSLELIQTAVAQVSKRAAGVVEEAEEQTNASRSVVGDIDSVAKVASENARATVDIRQALTLQSEGMEEIVSLSAKLFDMSARLGEAASRFRTR